MHQTKILPNNNKRDNTKHEPTIIVDSREAHTASKIVKGLKKLGVNIQIEVLDKGDYVLSDTCAIERKTVQDFVQTLTHRNLFQQLYELKEGYTKTLMLLEGRLPTIYEFSKIKPAAIWGTLFQLAKNGIPMINTTSYKESIDFLHVAARQEQIVKKRSPAIHPIKNYKTIPEAQIFLLASLPNIGKEKATAILKSHETPINALVNADKWPQTVHGLGPKITKKAREILSKPFEE